MNDIELVAIAQALSGTSVLTCLFAPLFTRLRAEEALLHATRGKVHALLAARGATSRREIAEALGLPPATLLHHLEMMEACGLLSSQRVGREVLYTSGPRVEATPALRAPSRQLIARLLLERPRTQVELSEATGLSQRLVAYHLARLEGVVDATAERPRRYVVRDPGAVRAQLS